MSRRRSFEVKIAETGDLLVSRCELADSMIARLVGLLDRDRLDEGHGLLLEPCNHVHTLFMRFPIDAVFLGRDNTVLGIDELVPWRLSHLFLKARKVLELPVGRCRRAGLKAGQRLEFSPCSN